MILLISMGFQVDIGAIHSGSWPCNNCGVGTALEDCTGCKKRRECRRWGVGRCAGTARCIARVSSFMLHNAANAAFNRRNEAATGKRAHSRLWGQPYAYETSSSRLNNVFLIVIKNGSAA